MSPSLPHPFGCLRVANQIEQPAQESDTVLPSESKLRSVRSEDIRERARVGVGASDCVGDDVSHRPGILAVGEQISRDASRLGDRQAPE